MPREVTPTGAIHPVAALFPLMSDDELDDLAADIKAHGLAHAVVLDKAGVLIDGRNRIAACERVGVEPRFTLFEGDDPVAFILSSNVSRRHLTKGQRAMAVAKARDFSKITTRQAAESGSVSQAQVAYAAVVLQYASELADQVMAGGSLTDAYQIALRRKEAVEADQRALAGLRKRYPDFARRVETGEWTIQQASNAASAAEQEANQGHEAERYRQEIKLLIEAIGPEVPITDPPDMAVRFERKSDGTFVPDPAPALNQSLIEQRDALQRLISVKHSLQAMENELPAIATDDWWPESHVMAVRSAVSQIVASAFAIVEKHNMVISGSKKLKVVKG